MKCSNVISVRWFREVHEHKGQWKDGIAAFFWWAESANPIIPTLPAGVDIFYGQPQKPSHKKLCARIHCTREGKKKNPNQSCFAASCSVLQPEGKKSELIEGVLAPLFSLWLTGVCRLQEYRNTPHSVVGRRWMLYLIAHFILSDRFLPKCLSALEVFSILQLILRLNTFDSFHSLKMCCDAPLVSLQRRLRSWVSWDEAVSGRT